MSDQERNDFEAWFDEQTHLTLKEQSWVKTGCWMGWQARAALAQQAVPEGWKLVPVEPTPEMVEAAFDSLEAYSLEGSIRRHYRAMLTAAPAAPVSVANSPQAEQQTESQQGRLTVEEIELFIYEHTKLNPNNADDQELVIYIVNAIRVIERTLATRWGVKLKESNQ